MDAIDLTAGEHRLNHLEARPGPRARPRFEAASDRIGKKGQGMLKFVVRRILWTIPIILLVIFMTFWMMRAIQGSPFRHDRSCGAGRGDGQPEPEVRPRPALVRPVREVRQGRRYVRPRAVARPAQPGRERIVKEHFPVSAELGGLAMILAILVGVPLGIIAALRANKVTDYCVMFFANLGFAVPSFLVSTLLIYYFAAQLGWFPTNGWDTASSKCCRSSP